MELLDLYDDNCHLIGKTIVRGEKIEIGNIMLSVIFIKNHHGEFLIQKTSKERGSKYTSTGGHVSHNENGLTTIIRELEEELGLKIAQEELTFIDLIKHPEKPSFINVYFLEKDIDIDKLTLQQEEVDSVKWLTKEEILELINKNEFSFSHGYLFKKYFL